MNARNAWDCRSRRQAIVFCGWLLVCGCSLQPEASAPVEDSGPGVKFTRFEAALRRLCQEGSSTIVADATGGVGVTSIRTVIDPPTAVWHESQTPQGLPTAEVTLVTRLTYSSLRPEAEDANAPSKIKPPEVMSPGILGKQAEKPEQETPVRSMGKQEEFRDTFDLVYRNERWEISTREVPESMRMLLEHALSVQ